MTTPSGNLDIIRDEIAREEIKDREDRAESRAQERDRQRMFQTESIKSAVPRYLIVLAVIVIIWVLWSIFMKQSMTGEWRGAGITARVSHNQITDYAVIDYTITNDTSISSSTISGILFNGSLYNFRSRDTKVSFVLDRLEIYDHVLVRVHPAE